MCIMNTKCVCLCVWQTSVCIPACTQNVYVSACVWQPNMLGAVYIANSCSVSCFRVYVRVDILACVHNMNMYTYT